MAARGIWLGALTLTALVTGIGLRLAEQELSRAPASGDLVSGGVASGGVASGAPPLLAETPADRSPERGLSRPPVAATAGLVPVSAPLPDRPAPPPPGPNGFAPADHYPISDWTLDYGEAGYIDRASIGDRPLSPDPLALGDVLTVAGWAGDPLVGIRFSHVLLTLCGKVVAAVAVGEPSPAIARTVHSNLGMAGWSARLPVSLLPRCQKPVLGAMAVRDRRFAYLLRGDLPLSLPPETVRTPDSETAPALKPADLPFLDRQKVTISGRSTTVRRCAASDCAPVGTLPGGDHTVAVLERRSGWTLLVAPTLAGWVADSAVKLPPTQKADPRKGVTG